MLPTLAQLKELSAQLAPTPSTRTYDIWWSNLDHPVRLQKPQIIADLWWRSDSRGFLGNLQASITNKSRSTWHPFNYKVANILMPKLPKAAQISQVWHTLGCLPPRGMTMPTHPANKQPFAAMVKYSDTVVAEYAPDFPPYLLDVAPRNFQIILPAAAQLASLELVCHDTLDVARREPHFVASFTSSMHRFSGIVYASHLILKPSSIEAAAKQSDEHHEFVRAFWSDPAAHLCATLTAREYFYAMIRAHAEHPNSGLLVEPL